VVTVLFLVKDFLLDWDFIELFLTRGAGGSNATLAAIFTGTETLFSARWDMADSITGFRHGFGTSDSGARDAAASVRTVATFVRSAVISVRRSAISVHTCPSLASQKYLPKGMPD
jgi:hypothetical protein